MSRQLLERIALLEITIKGKPCGVGQRADLTGCVPKSGRVALPSREQVYAGFDELSEHAEDGVIYADVGTLSKEAQTVLRAVTIFTAGHVAAARDSTRYNPEKAAPIEGPGIYHSGWYHDRFEFTPTQADFDVAEGVLRYLCERPRRQSKHFSTARGLALDEDVAAALREGQSLDLGPIVSFSRDSNKAYGFALDEAERTEKTPVMLYLHPTHGTDVSQISRYPDEREFLTNGAVTISSPPETEEEDGLLCYHLDIEPKA